MPWVAAPCHASNVVQGAQGLGRDGKAGRSRVHARGCAHALLRQSVCCGGLEWREARETLPGDRALAAATSSSSCVITRSNLLLPCPLPRPQHARADKHTQATAPPADEQTRRHSKRAVASCRTLAHARAAASKHASETRTRDMLASLSRRPLAHPHPHVRPVRVRVRKRTRAWQHGAGRTRRHALEVLAHVVVARRTEGLRFDEPSACRVLCPAPRCVLRMWQPRVRLALALLSRLSLPLLPPLLPPRLPPLPLRV